MNESEKKVLRIMENPVKANKEDIEALKEEDVRRDCRILSDTAAVLEEDLSVAPDIEKELEDFHAIRKKNSMRKRILHICAAASAVSLLIWAGINRMQKTTSPISIALEADPYPQKITIEVSEPQTGAVMHTKTIETDSMPKEYFLKGEEIRMHRLNIPRGHSFNLLLPDGTEVFLNAETRFSYPTEFTGKTRNVFLEGEAHFKVSGNNPLPFIVKTEKALAKVLGTEFNISSYSASDMHVTLICGSLEVKTANKSRIIEPGEDLRLCENGEMEVEKIDLDSYVHWRDGYFYFDNTPLLEVMKSLGRWYNVGIEFHNPKVMKCKIHFHSDRRKGVEHSLTLLNRMEKARFSLKAGKIIIE